VKLWQQNQVETKENVKESAKDAAIHEQKMKALILLWLR
jgi:hypothetical protein